MSVITHNLGFPRIGLARQTKFAVEAYWRDELSQEDLLAKGRELRAQHWQTQADAGIDLVPVGDFCWYDHVLDMAMTLGVIPKRFASDSNRSDIDLMFDLARGRRSAAKDVAACEMTKWFNTNYHYIVPEISHDQTFSVNVDSLLAVVGEAQALDFTPKPVIIGPLTFLWLSKVKGQDFDKLSILDDLLLAYRQILLALHEAGVQWVQIDEPILVMDLPKEWQAAFENAYHVLHAEQPRILLTTYFGALEDNLSLACELPVAGLHIDGVCAPNQIELALDRLPEYKVLSVGIIDGRNIWRTDLQRALEQCQPLLEQLGDRLWLAPSCSLLHCPVDLEQESNLDDELKSWLAFAVQKVSELVVLAKALEANGDGSGDGSIGDFVLASSQAVKARQESSRINNAAVKERVTLVQADNSMAVRNHEYQQRASVQKENLQLPMFPTTTIGSFPQTKEIRQLRRSFKAGELGEQEYQQQLQNTITQVIRQQEQWDLDVLVHGESERNDMVEYFGELLDGFAFTQHAWVQSYGSRCVKPPIIYGDVVRRQPMTVQWMEYAQAQTDRLLKGMLTGPVTILSWSFVRDDQPRETTAMQIALALRDEVVDLEQAGIKIIQIDEPAFREGLPLRKSQWQQYLSWAVKAFRVASSGVADSTQIHTHMCYSEFNDIINAIAELDADVITIETSRSQMELLAAFEQFEYPNEIGPGVYDIHSPIVPSVDDIVGLLERAATLIPIERIWVNPDCGLKTRDWPEVEDALKHMVVAAKQLRDKYQEQAIG